MDNLRLILTGKMGSGKDFAAAELCRHHGAVAWSRTELMKRLAHAVVDHIGDPEVVLERIFPDSDERAEVRDALFAYQYQPEHGKPRRLYQDIVDICMDYDPYCFERELATRIDEAGDCPFSLIDDVRSLAAFEFFSDRGYKSLRIEAPEEVRRNRMLQRDGYLPSQDTFEHPSETELDGVPHNFIIFNADDNAERLYQDIERIINELRQS